MNADPRVMKMLGGTVDAQRSSATADRMTAGIERDGFGWWVADVKGGVPFAGLIALKEVAPEFPFTPKFEVGWRFIAEAWGNGYATEGARAALDYAFTTLDRDEVVAMTAKINLPSQRVMQRLGMIYDPAADFEHPAESLDVALKPHVLYRAHRARVPESTNRDARPGRLVAN
jgi:RimJ/RimL family protein N-acetyltransferase